MLDRKIVDEIRKVVKKQLRPAHIVDVSVTEEVDFEGDDILRVDVVFEAEGDRLDPEKVTGLVRHIRAPLKEMKETRFPLLSFSIPDEVNDATAWPD